MKPLLVLKLCPPQFQVSFFYSLIQFAFGAGVRLQTGLFSVFCLAHAPDILFWTDFVGWCWLLVWKTYIFSVKVDFLLHLWKVILLQSIIILVRGPLKWFFLPIIKWANQIFFFFFLQSVETLWGFLLKPLDTSLDKSADNCTENKNTFAEPSSYEET